MSCEATVLVTAVENESTAFEGENPQASEVTLPGTPAENSKPEMGKTTPSEVTLPGTPAENSEPETGKTTPSENPPVLGSPAKAPEETAPDAGSNPPGFKLSARKASKKGRIFPWLGKPPKAPKPCTCCTPFQHSCTLLPHPFTLIITRPDEIEPVNMSKNTISREDAEQLLSLGILIKDTNGGLVINPVARPLLLGITQEQLNAFAKTEDNFTKSYIEMAKCFYVDKNGELAFEDNGCVATLLKYLPKIDSDPIMNSRASRLLGFMYSPGLTLLNIQNKVDVSSLKQKQQEELKDEGFSSPKIIDLITVRANTSSAKCPYCGQETTEKCKKSGSFSRTLQDIPVNVGVPLFVEVEGLRRYYCQNPECSHKGHMFDECLPFFQPKIQRTNRCNALLLGLSVESSFHGAERMMEHFGVRVSDDSIRKILMKIKFPDDPHIESIGIDDIADRKGVSYLTVVYALTDHRLLAILDGRDGTELEKWLDSHLDVRLICRDRASAYAKHIDAWAERHGVKVDQIADRFHLVKNHIDHLKKAARSYLPDRVAFEKETGKILDTIPKKVAKARGKKPDDSDFEKWQYDNTPVTDKEGNPIILDLSARKEEEDGNDAPAQGEAEQEEGSPAQGEAEQEEGSPAQGEAEQGNGAPAQEGAESPESDTKGKQKKKTKAQQRKETSQEKRNDKYANACKMRQEFDPLKPKMVQYEALAEKYNVSAGTVRRYVNMTPDELEGLKVFVRKAESAPRAPRAREIDNYKYMIYKMLKDNHTIGDVFWYIKKQDYKRSDSNLAGYICDIYSIVFPTRINPGTNQYIKFDYPDSAVVLTRNEIMKYLVTVNPKTEKNAYLKAQEDVFMEKYPKAKLFRDAFLKFHGVIMGEDESALEKLCKEKCSVKELQGFYKHILEQDMDAVKNAIKYSFSSGFVEGNNNRIKTIKRQSYGRLKMSTLMQKCMVAFWSTLDGFQLGGIVTWVPLHEDIDNQCEFWAALGY